MHRMSVIGSPRRACACGFTLIELLVVVAILLLMASVLPMALNRALPGRRVATTAEAIMSFVREAKSLSLQSGKSVTLQLQQGGLILAGMAAAGGTGVHGRSFPASVRVDLLDPAGIAMPGLTVFPDGSAQAGVFEVEEGDHRALVHVSAITGRVRIEQS